MSTIAPARRPGRIAAVASAIALLVATVFAAGAPSAVAGGSSGATVAVTPTTTTTSTATSAVFKVSNTKTAITKITITAPKGLTVTLGVVQTGWTSSLTGCGATSSCVATYTATASKYGVGNGANGNVSFGLNFTSPSSATTLGFVVKGKAGSDDYYLNKTVSITVKGAVVASAVTLTGLTAPNSAPNYVAGTAVTGTVTLKDTNGNPIAITDTTKLSASKTAGAGTFGPVFTLNGDGTARIAFTYTKADTLTFTVGYNTGSSTLSSSPATTLVYVPAAAATVAVGTPYTGTNSPGPFTAGSTVKADVTVSDTYGNQVKLTSTAGLTASQKTGSGTWSSTGFTVNANGTATFSFVYTKADTVTFTVSYNALTSTPDTSAAFQAASGTVLSLGQLTDGTTPGGPFTAGTQVTGTLTLTDTYGNKVNLVAGDLNATQTGGLGAFSPTFGYAGGNGTITFTYTKADTLSFSVSKGSGAGAPTTTGSASYTPAAGTVLTLGTLTDGTTPGGPFTAGTPVTAPVTLADEYGNQVALTSGLTADKTDGDGAFSPTFSYGDGDGEIAFTYTKADTLSFTVSYASLTSNEQSADFVTGAVDHLTVGTPVAGSPASSTQPFTAGSTVTVPVSLYDANDNLIAPSAADLAALSATQTGSGTGVFDPTAFVADSSGNASATFTFIDTVVETQSFNVSYDAIAASNNPTSVEFTYDTLSLVVDSIDNISQPGSSTIYSGDTVELNFTIADQYGNQVLVSGNDPRITVSATSSKGGHFVKTGGGLAGTESYVLGYYDIDEEDVVLTVTDTTLSVSGDWTQTFVKQVAVDEGTFVPGVPAAVKTGNTENGLQTCSTNTACGWADLPNGANGFVTATITGTSLDITGENGTETFKDADGDPLYSNDAPLPVTFVCGSAVCPTNTMPQNNGSQPSSSAFVGSPCTVGPLNFYPWAPLTFTGTVFNYGAAGKYCLFNAPSERVDFAQAFGFSYQLAGQSSLSPLTSSCTVAFVNGDGKSVALPIGAMNPGTDYADETTIPDLDADGNPLRACMNVHSITSVVTGANTTDADYYLNFTALFADDITLRLR